MQGFFLPLFYQAQIVRAQAMPDQIMHSDATGELPLFWL